MPQLQGVPEEALENTREFASLTSRNLPGASQSSLEAFQALLLASWSLRKAPLEPQGDVLSLSEAFWSLIWSLWTGAP